MDIELTNTEALEVSGLEEGSTYVAQVSQFNYTGTIGYTQADSAPTTFFWGRCFKFKVKSGYSVYFKAGRVPALPIKIHIEEV